MVRLRGVVFLVGLAGSGCVSTEKVSDPKSTEQETPRVEMSLEWQEVLHKDIVNIETQGNSFLEAAFNLYDLLLDESLSASQELVNSHLMAAGARYDELAKAILELKLHLNDPRIKAELPLSHAQGEAEYQILQELVERFPERKNPILTYDFQNSPTISAILFGRELDTDGASLQDIPKAHRDALRLLDQLRSTSSSLAQATLTVTDWVDVTKVKSGDVAHH